LPLIPEKHNPIDIDMKNVGRGAPRVRPRCALSPRRLVRVLWTLSLCLFVCLGTLSTPTSAQAPGSRPSPVDPLPADTGVAGLKQTLLRLQTTARLMQTTAHPDDEDGGMLTLESRSKGVSTLLMTLTRGEGGQNKIGSNLFDVLGVLRTLELTASDRYYGVEQRFSRVADFGYSKNPDETFQKWGGHDIALGDMVRVIRTFRPDVLIARFSGTQRDGHGHHQASAILTREAFRAASDPTRFPEQIKEGLLPWQPKKLYIGNVCGFGAMTCPAENYTIKLNTGAVNPLLGMSYIQFALEGLRHQLSQGAGGWSVEPGDRFTYYKLVDSMLPPATDKDGHEKDFFDGMDTSLPGLASRLGEEEKKVPLLRQSLGWVAQAVRQAAEQSETDQSAVTQHLRLALMAFEGSTSELERSNVSKAAKLDVLARLNEKSEQLQRAFNLATNVSLEATVIPSTGPEGTLPHEPDALTLVSPGQKLTIRVKFHSGTRDLRSPTHIEDIWLDGWDGWSEHIAKGDIIDLASGKDFYVNFKVQVPQHVQYTRPFQRRDDPERDATYKVDAPQYQTLAFPPLSLRAHATYPLFIIDPSSSGGPRNNNPSKVHGRVEISAPVMVPFLDHANAPQKRPLAVVPAFSVMLEPGIQTIRTKGDPGCDVKVGVSYNLSIPAKGTLRLQIPPSWRVEPAELAVNFHERNEKQDFQFRVFPASLKEGLAQIRAVLSSGGTEYSEGYSLVTREDLASFYYYQPAVQRVSIVDVNVPKDLKVAYIPGAGDEIPTVLQQIGIDVTVIPAEKLAGEDLTRYGTIVLGIRAYDTQKDVAANNKKLLDYVSAGGTLIVQYNASVGDFNSGHVTPFPAQLSRGRVSVEEAPVEILAPDDSVFHHPNPIQQADFDGWVQERGLYFADQWDSNFKPLLSSHDPGEQPLKGGLLRAQYGKGTYIYTGYAFFRQLPAGVPGAIRLFVNLLAAGH
jgi:LmbE family N-acetylglucosaminyl deacetylase